MLFKLAQKNGRVKRISHWVTEIAASTIYHLAINNEKLPILPRFICALRFIDVLDLSHNNLKTVPSQICQLQQLTTLKMRDNQLTKVASSLGSMPRLTMVDFGENPFLEKLPQSFARWEAMTSTHFQNTHFFSPYPYATRRIVILDQSCVIRYTLTYSQIPQWPSKFEEDSVIPLPAMQQISLRVSTLIKTTIIRNIQPYFSTTPSTQTPKEQIQQH
jgi:hypothetical protein